MIRYGTVGTGWIAESFIGGAGKCPDLFLAAVYSRNHDVGKSFAERHTDHGETPHVYTNLEEMAASRVIDAVYIASPNSLHYEQAKLFLSHGKHVICEKPVTVTPEELTELYSIAQEKKVIFIEAIMMMHLPALPVLRQALSRIGRIRTARFDFSQLSSKYPAYLKGELPNIFNPIFCTGSFMDLGIYCVYPALLLFGQPESCFASAYMMDTGADGAGSSVFNYKDKQVLLTYSKLGQSHTSSEILGDEGTITIESVSKLSGIVLHHKDGSTEELYGTEDKETLMSYEAADFARYIRSPAASAAEYGEMRRMAMMVSSQMYEIRRKAGISFPSDKF